MKKFLLVFVVLAFQTSAYATDGQITVLGVRTGGTDSTIAKNQLDYLKTHLPKPLGIDVVIANAGNLVPGVFIPDFPPIPPGLDLHGANNSYYSVVATKGNTCSGNEHTTAHEFGHLASEAGSIGAYLFPFSHAELIFVNGPPPPFGGPPTLVGSKTIVAGGSPAGCLTPGVTCSVKNEYSSVGVTDNLRTFTTTALSVANYHMTNLGSGPPSPPTCYIEDTGTCSDNVRLLIVSGAPPGGYPVSSIQVERKVGPLGPWTTVGTGGSGGFCQPSSGPPGLGTSFRWTFFSPLGNLQCSDYIYLPSNSCNFGYPYGGGQPY